jgi:hypothetical protein
MAAPTLQQLNLVNQAANAAYNGLNALILFDVYSGYIANSPAAAAITGVPQLTNFNAAAAAIVALMNASSGAVGSAFRAMSEFSPQSSIPMVYIVYPILQFSTSTAQQGIAGLLTLDTYLTEEGFSPSAAGVLTAVWSGTSVPAPLQTFTGSVFTAFNTAVGQILTLLGSPGVSGVTGTVGQALAGMAEYVPAAA